MIILWSSFTKRQFRAWVGNLKQQLPITSKSSNFQAWNETLDSKIAQISGCQEFHGCHLKPWSTLCSHSRLSTDLPTRWVSVVEFHDRALCIGKVFGQESTVVKWNYQILSLHLVTVCQKVPILDFQSEFWIEIFLRNIFIEEYQFRRTFFVKSIFCWLQFQNHFIY